MKYKTGDRVKIKSLEWYIKNKDEDGDVRGAFFDAERTKYCGQVVTIDSNGYNLGSGTIIYAIKEGYEWIGEKAIEGLAEDLKHKEKPSAAPEKVILNGVEVMRALQQVEALPNTIKVCELPDGYEFRDENNNVIQAKKIVLEKKKPKYPKTLTECIVMMGYPIEVDLVYSCDYQKTKMPKDMWHRLRRMNNLYFLLLCRDAYWKLEGDWKPDWAMYSGRKHCIIYSDNEIKWQGQHFVTETKVLAFPTEEMRDAFYENFKELIEECKELL